MSSSICLKLAVVYTSSWLCLHIDRCQFSDRMMFVAWADEWVCSQQSLLALECALCSEHFSTQSTRTTPPFGAIGSLASLMTTLSFAMLPMLQYATVDVAMSKWIACRTVGYELVFLWSFSSGCTSTYSHRLSPSAGAEGQRQFGHAGRVVLLGYGRLGWMRIPYHCRIDLAE